MIYLSGPMASVPNHNFPAFEAAALKLRNEGHSVLSPHELGQRDEWEWSDYLTRDLIVMLQKCSSIYMLKGWENSRGARLELYVAETLGFEINYEGTIFQPEYGN